MGTTTKSAKAHTGLIFGERMILELLAKKARSREELRDDTATRIGAQSLNSHMKRLHAGDMIRMGPKVGGVVQWQLTPKGAHAIGEVLDEELFAALAGLPTAPLEALAIRVDMTGPEPVIEPMRRCDLVEQLRQRARDCCDDLNVAARLITMSDCIAKEGAEVPVLTVRAKSSSVSWIVREQPARAA